MLVLSASTRNWKARFLPNCFAGPLLNASARSLFFFSFDFFLNAARSVWMFAWGWVYRAFSPLHAREARNMGPIREFAELVLKSAAEAGGSSRPGARSGGSTSRETTGSSVGSSGSSSGGSSGSSGSSSGGSSGSSVTGRDHRGGEVVPGLAASLPRAGECGGERPPSSTASAGAAAGGGAGMAAAAAAGGVGPRTALFKMATRESHRVYPGSMVDEVSRQ